MCRTYLLHLTAIYAAGFQACEFEDGFTVGRVPHCRPGGPKARVANRQA